ncbi:hypothetical protein LTR28_008614 [Elasticomyces elasticus]|nr:hypothetical protein LTR28_008614 [Elasticomyces elasticus]
MHSLLDRIIKTLFAHTLRATLFWLHYQIIAWAIETWHDVYASVSRFTDFYIAQAERRYFEDAAMERHEGIFAR